MTSFPYINRRTALQSVAGLGALAAINPLTSLATGGNQVKSAKKLVLIVNNLGFNPKTFYPKKADLNDSPLLSRLKAHHDGITVPKDIMQPTIDRGHKASKGIWTCNAKQANGPYISLDQFIAGNLQQSTRYKTVNMAGQSLVWDKNSRTVDTLKERGPEAVFDHLFGQTPTDSIRRELDALRASRRALPNGEGAGAYQAALDEREQELLVELEWASKPVPKVECDTNLHLSDHHGRGVMNPFRQQLELIRLGMKHQRGQIFTASPPYIDKTDYGVGAGYHALGHGQHREQNKFTDMLKLEQTLMDSFADFLGSMKENGQWEDTIVLFMGGFSDPGAHSRKYLPAVLAGGGFRHQGLLECKQGDRLEHTLSELYVSICHQMGVDVGEFAGAKGNLDKVIS